MKKIFVFNILILLLSATISKAQVDRNTYDVVIYGATSSGIMAAVEAKRNGVSVVLLSPEKHIGGLTSSGLGWTDMGDQDKYATIGGLSLDFFKKVRSYYQSNTVWKHESFSSYQKKLNKSIYRVRDSVMWTFEPHVAENIFNDYITSNNIPLKLNVWLNRKSGVKKEGNKITEITMLNGDTYKGKVFIDATYEGDLMAAAGISYTIGREANSVYNETINGIQEVLSTGNNLPAGISPYLNGYNGKLLPTVNKTTGGIDGSGDKKVQAYCYRMCLTDVPENRIMVSKPANYKSKDFELVVRAALKGETTFWKFSAMPNRKTDSNNDGGVSMDYIGMNYDYPEASYKKRRKIDAEHIYWTKGLIWTVQNDPRIPDKVRKKYANWGLPKDEFLDNDHFPYRLYVREARRMVSNFVMSEKYLEGIKEVPESVGMGNYNMDSHNVQRYITKKGDVQNEGDVQIAVKKPYGISYQSIVPKLSECSNMLVPVCLSASHVAYGSIRMEPVFMVLGQSAGKAAVLAIKNQQAVQSVDYNVLKKSLLASGQILTLKD